MSIFTDNIFSQDPLEGLIEEKTTQLKEGERRTVAILFADLKGFTELSEKLDPELVQTTIDKIMNIFTQVIENHGGYIDKYSGDEVMALFGAKVASEADTERAIRAGLQMLKNLERFNTLIKTNKNFNNIDTSLAVRIGINTGLVTTGKIGKGREGDFTVYGDSVNLASRLESNAPVNSIMVPESIEKMLVDHFEFLDQGNIKVKGKTDPISVFTVGKIKDSPSVVEDKYLTKFVGREEELTELKKSYHIAIGNIGKDESCSTILAIKASAGIGKTRLVHEFIFQSLSNSSTSKYLSIGRSTNVTGQPFFTFLSLFRHYFHISEIDSSKVMAEKITDGYSKLEEHLEEQDRVILSESQPMIGFLFGLLSDDGRLKTKGKDLQSHIHIAVFQLLRCMTLRCNQSSIPMVFILEDLHWIDDASLEVLKFIITGFSDLSDKKGITNLFILNYRPSFTLPVEIAKEEDCKEIDMLPLSDDYSTNMIENALDLGALPDYEMKNILEISSGNPFYIEEWIAYISSYEEEEKLSIEDILKKYPVPTSLNALVLSRVDALSENDKGVLQTASVMGVNVHSSILQLLHEKLDTKSIIKNAVKILVERDLLIKVSDDEYSFKSSISRDVIYEAILQSNRKMLHLEIGNLIEGHYDEGLDSYYYELAEHFDRSNEYDKALVYLEKSGDKARQMYNNKMAADFYTRLSDIYKNSDYTGNILALEQNNWKIQNTNESKMLSSFLKYELLRGDMLTIIGKWDMAESILSKALLPAKADDDPLRYPACASKLAEVCRVNNNFKESRKWLSTGLSDCKKHTDHEDYIHILFSILSRMASLNIDEGKLDDAEKVLNEIKAIIDELNDPLELTVLHGNFGTLYLQQGKVNEAYSEFEKMYDLCEKYNYKNKSTQALVNLGVIHNMQGKLNDAIEIFIKMIKVCEELGDRKVAAQTYGNLAISQMFLKNYELAAKNYQIQIAISKKLGDKFNMIRANNNIGYNYIEMGDYKKAIEYTKISIKINDEVGVPDSRAQSCDNLGLAYIQLGEFDKAQQYYNEGLSIFNEIGNKRGAAEVEGGLGIISMEEEKYKDALKYFTSALEEFEIVKDQRLMAQYYLKRAIVYYVMKDYDNAHNDINRSLENSLAVDDKNLHSQGNLYGVLNEIAAKKLSENNALKLFKEFDDNALNQEGQALYYFHLWQLTGDDQHKEKSLKLYKTLDAEKPSYFFKKYVAQLQL